MVYVAARTLGCAPDTIKSRLSKSANLRAIREQAEGLTLDLTERVLERSALNGDPWAVQFMLKTKGKNRGYVERQEVAGADGNDIKIRVVYDTDD